MEDILDNPVSFQLSETHQEEDAEIAFDENVINRYFKENSGNVSVFT